MAQLGKDDRILDLYIAKGPNTPTGGEMFEEAIKAFGLSNIKGIRGTWLGGGDLRTNFDAFQKAIKAGLTPSRRHLRHSLAQWQAVRFHQGNGHN